jgi:uncharacterized peroxidase-related enzyme
MFIETPKASEASEQLFADSAKSMGFVMNLTKAWAWRPEIFNGFAALRNQLTTNSTLTKRDQAVIVCATASELGDSYCSLAWGKTLAAEAGASVAAAVISGASEESLVARDRALVVWARKVVSDPNGTTAADIEEMRTCGFTDREIFEATTFIAFRLAFSTVNDALGVQPDWQLAESADPLVREAVTFGRRALSSPHGRSVSGERSDA